MSRAALSTFIAIASFHLANAGLTEPLSTYPATPLASKTFAYPSGIVSAAATWLGWHTTDLFAAIPSRYRRSPPWNPIRLQSLQLDHRRPRFPLSNVFSKFSRWCAVPSCLFTVSNTLTADFCLWAPPEANSTIADTEGEEVAWCTKPGRGTRTIPAGALQGVQFMKTPDYVQVVGFIDQTFINMQSDDSGGELDPHGADLVSPPAFRGHCAPCSSRSLRCVCYCASPRVPVSAARVFIPQYTNQFTVCSVVTPWVVWSTRPHGAGRTTRTRKSSNGTSTCPLEFEFPSSL